MQAVDYCHQNAKLHFFPTPLVSSVEFWITGYYDPFQLRLAGSQDTDLSCHMPVSTFCYAAWSQSH